MGFRGIIAYGAFLKHISIALLITTCLVTQSFATDLNPNRYEVYYGDLNNDSYSDIYFRGKETIIMIHDDIVIPIVLPAPESFRLEREYELPDPEYGTGGGPIDNYLGPFAHANLSDADIISKGLVRAADNDVVVGDFNGDGHSDMLVRGESLNASDPSIILAGNDQTYPSKLAIYTANSLQYHNLLDRNVVLEVRDVNGDGKDDLVVPSGDSSVADSAYISDSTGPKTYQPIYKNTVEPATLAGSTGGQFRVDESGAATYSIPLALPAGVAGVAPELSLNYSSQGGNGPLGKGWGLSGLSAISRCRQTLGQDGQAKPLSFSAEDRFCLDGQRLIVDAGFSYGAVGATYKTEIDSFATVTAHGGSVGHPAYFTVTRKDGSTSTYGGIANTRRVVGSGTLTWAISEFKDNLGNRIEYSYGDGSTGQSSAEFYLEEIRYAYAGSEAKTRITFDYEARPDITSGFLNGEELKNSRRLQQVHIFNTVTTEQEVKTYHLGYLNEAISRPNKVSLLSSLQECMGSDCLPATVFSWQEQKIAYGPASAEHIFTDQGDQILLNYQYADIDGNGCMDIVYAIRDTDTNSDDDDDFRYVMSDCTEFQRGTFTNGQQVIGFDGPGIRLEIIDYNADGRSDVAVFHPDIGFWRIYLSTLNSATNEWRLSSTAINTSFEKNTTFIDLNADGLVDALSGTSVYQLQPSGAEINSSTFYDFSSADQLVWGGVSQAFTPSEYSVVKTEYEKSYGLGVGDFNGDGVVDLIGIDRKRTWFNSETICTEGCGIEQEDQVYVLIRDGNQLIRKLFLGRMYDRYVNSYNSQSKFLTDFSIRAADFNGDGFAEILKEVDGKLYIYHNDGKNFSAPVLITSLPDKANLQILDYNRDGLLDIVWQEVSGNVRIKIKYNENGQFGATSEIGTMSSGSSSSLRLFLDMNGDALVDHADIINQRITSRTSLSEPGLLYKIDNGIGNVTTITYEPMARSDNYTPLSATDSNSFYQALNGPLDIGDHNSQALPLDSPVLNIVSPMYLAVHVQSTSPEAGVSPGGVQHQAVSAIEYFYSEAKLQAAGRGNLGFKTVSSKDLQTGVVTTTQYRQDFPFIGMPLSTEVRSSQNRLLSYATNTWELENWNSGNPVAPYRPFIAHSVEKNYDLANNGAVQGALLSTVVTSNIYDDYNNDGSSDAGAYYGNVSKITVSTTNNVSGVVESTKITTNSYGSTDWEKQLGRLSATTVETQRGSDSLSRQSAFVYYDLGDSACSSSALGLSADSLKGLLCKEIVDPASSYEVTTRYEYDGFGNKIKAVQSTAGETDRSSRSEYDSDGRYLVRQFNSLNHKVEEITERNSPLGLPTKITGLNGLVTTLQYDALGREIYRADNTGAWAQTYYERCAQVSCIAGAQLRVKKTVAGGGWSMEYLDTLGRTMRSAAVSFIGQENRVDTEYDNLGRVKRKSEPHTSVATHWTEFSYDILGRVTATQLPGITNPASVQYSGFTTVTTNPVGQTKTETRNALGELVEVKDNLNGKVQYQYDTVGNLRYVHTLGNGDVTTSTANSHGTGVASIGTIQMCYDTLGRKIAMRDPDKGGRQAGTADTCPTNTTQATTGWWLYNYNNFGELISQIDARGQTSTMTYDQLGRMETRLDKRADNSIEGNTTWTYDTATNGLGQLDNVQDSVSGFMRAHTYDSLGRPETTQTQFSLSGESHWERVTYDSLGRTHQVFDAGADRDGASVSWSSNAVENQYNSHGYLSKVVDAFDTTESYYTVVAMDARGNVTQSLGGNGVTTQHTFEDATGRLQSILSDRIGPDANVQEQRYTWDDIGNLTKRIDKSAGKDLEENFTGYDGLNRLTHYQVVGRTAQVVEYFSNGNIKSKTEVGTYTYGNNAGPHAVTATSDGVSYSYDANGNMTSDTAVGNLGGRTLLYTTFDKPYQITKGGHTTEFKYGPDRARYYRKDTNSSSQVTETVYLSGVEKITRPDNSREIKRYLPGGALMTISLTSGGVETGRITQYLLKDHLGSVDVITNGAGVVTEELSFDAWGQRRNAINWDGLDVASLLSFDHSTTTRGFTGHEMLDEVGLVHMNGRIYDARLGRFLQADPYIQEPGLSQNYNRYTYVLNNPIAYTDPSGFNFFREVFDDILGISESPLLNSIVQIGICFLSGPYCPGALAAYNTAFTYGVTGDLGDAVWSGLVSGVSAYAFSQIGGADLSFPTRVLAHGVTGGLASVFQGGKFGHGFVTSGLAKYAMGSMGFDYSNTNWDAIAGRTVIAAIVGGTVSEITGGKFGNGAVTAAIGHLLNAESEGIAKNIAQKVRYNRRAKNWRDAEKLEAGRQAKLKGQSVIKGRVGANYDGDNYIGSRLYDVVSVDDAGHWTLTEVKFRSGRMNRYWPFKAVHGATIYSQSEFDYGATVGLTLVGKNIPGGSITLSQGEYSIQWVMMNDRGSGSLYSVDIGNEGAMLINVMRAYPHDEKWWD